MATTEYNEKTCNTGKWEIFMMLLAKAPVMQVVEEEGFEEDGRLTAEAEVQVGSLVRDANAVTDCIWRTLIDINNESKKQPEKRSAR